MRSAPADMLVLETDAPYLEPEPRSLRRNEPALLGRVLARLCAIRGWSREEATAITRANAKELFRLPIELATPARPSAPRDANPGPAARDAMKGPATR